MSEKQD